MSNTQDQLHQELRAQNAILQVIALELTHIAAHLAPESPNFRRPFEALPDFDWSRINATIVDRDDFGATVVEWHGHYFTRRTGQGNKFGRAVWYSRPLGSGENGTEYARLISFKDYSQAEPLAEPLTGQLAGPPPADRSPAAAQHLTYGDGAQVADNETAINSFNRFLAEQRRPPKSATELKTSFSNGGQ